MEKISAAVTSIQRRTQAVVISANDPAKAIGAKTADTTISTLRTISAAHTMITAARAASESRMMPAGLAVTVLTVPPARRAWPRLVMEPPVAACHHARPRASRRHPTADW